jgi:hypothetical protein
MRRLTANAAQLAALEATLSTYETLLPVAEKQNDVGAMGSIPALRDAALGATLVQQLAYLYFEDEPQRQMSMKRLSRDEAFLIAVNIAKLPSVPRQILKDIPRPPNSASRDD